VVGGERKKGNTEARALTEFEKAERAEKSKARATDRAKPNVPETSSGQAATESSLTVPEFHADTAVLGSHHNIKKARSMGVLREGLTDKGSQ